MSKNLSGTKLDLNANALLYKRLGSILEVKD
jgi:hypothetical protein